MKFIALNQYYYYNDLISDLSKLKIAYPDKISSRFIGNTVSNRAIFMIQIGKGKKGIILTGGVHGRESINPVVLMAMMEYYAMCLEDEMEAELFEKKTGIQLNAFLEEYTIYMIPLLNPDGYMIALQGFELIHNQELRNKAEAQGVPFEEWKANANSIDINRNFPSKNYVPKFEGDKAGSELETMALMRVFEEIESEAYIDYHSRGNEIYYYRKQMTDQYNEKALKIARNLQKTTGYSIVKPDLEIETGDTGGNTVHYYSEVYKKPAITIETVPEPAKFPLALKYQRIIYSQILYTPFYLNL